jgi:hypothetical protein
MISSHHSGCSSAAVPMFRCRSPARARGLVAVPPEQFDVQPQVRGDLGDDLGIVASPEGSIQVNQVDPLGSSILPALGGCAWITKPLLRACASLDQLHGLSSCDVDSRQQDQPVAARRSARGTCRKHQMTLSPRASSTDCALTGRPPDSPPPSSLANMTSGHTRAASSSSRRSGLPLIVRLPIAL